MSPRDVHRFMLDRAREEPLVCLIVQWMRLVDLSLAIYDSARVEPRGDYEFTFLPIAKIALELFAATHGTHYVYILLTTFRSWELASDQERKVLANIVAVAYSVSGLPIPSDYFVECVVRDMRSLIGHHYNAAAERQAKSVAPRLAKLMHLRRNALGTRCFNPRTDQGISIEDKVARQFCLKYNIWGKSALRGKDGNDLPRGEFTSLSGVKLNPELLFWQVIGRQRLEEASQHFLGELPPVSIPNDSVLFEAIVHTAEGAKFLHQQHALAATSADETELRGTFLHPVSKKRRYLTGVQFLVDALLLVGGQQNGETKESLARLSKKALAVRVAAARVSWKLAHAGTPLPGTLGALPERDLADAADQPLVSLEGYEMSDELFEDAPPRAGPPVSSDGAAAVPAVIVPTFGADDFAAMWGDP